MTFLYSSVLGCLPRLSFPPPSYPPPIVSQSRGYPRPGIVLTFIHPMWSIPLSLVQRVLQAITQVWQPMHLLRSITNAICFLASAIILSPSINFLPGGDIQLCLSQLDCKRYQSSNSK